MAGADGIIYVTPTGAGSKNGSSWSNATDDLQGAVNYAALQKTKPDVWVAKGTYYGDSIAENNAFCIKDGVHVYGSFAGNESASYNLSERDFENNISILDGQNVQRVLCQENEANKLEYAIWDGFRIQNGRIQNASGAGAYMLSLSQLENCDIVNNKDTSDVGNYESCYGAGVYVVGISTYYPSKLINCRIRNNMNVSNYYAYGGGVYAKNAQLTNCEIIGNYSVHYGGGVYAGYDASFVNCNIIGNTIKSNTGAGINVNGTSSFINCIVWGNKKGEYPNQIYDTDYGTFKYCAVQDGISGIGNIALAAENTGEGIMYPNFADVAAGNYQLLEGSICINNGDTTGLILPATDLVGNKRIQRGQIDIGAYESTHESTSKIIPDTNGIVYVTQTGAGKKDGSSWNNATPYFQYALNKASSFASKTRVWVAAGIYYGDGQVSNSAFLMTENVDVFGGFAGNESADYDLTLRNFNANATILDGQSVQRVLYQPTSFTVKTQTTWDGFTIQNGQNSLGGAGVYLNEFAHLRNCIVKNNTSLGYGDYNSCGGIFSYGYSSVQYPNTITNCKIYNNKARANVALYLYNTTLVNCDIAGNGDVYRSPYAINAVSNVIMQNCNIVNNTATLAAIRSYSTMNVFTNCIIWGNKKADKTFVQTLDKENGIFSYCAVENGLNGTSNINLANENDGVVDSLNYPAFVNMLDYDFRLFPSSACINAGDSTGITAKTDLEGNARIYGDTIDIGAYEYSGKTYCLRPADVKISNIKGTMAYVSWQNSNKEEYDHCVLEYKTTTTEEWTAQNITRNYAFLTGLLPETEYQVRIKTVCNNTESSSYSEIILFTTTASELGCVSPVMVVDGISYHTIDLLWAYEGDDCELQYKKSDETEYIPLKKTENKISISGLRHNTSYDIRMRTVCGGSYSAWITQSITTLCLPLEKIYVASAASNTDGNSWEEATNDLQWAVNTAKTIRDSLDIKTDVWVSKGIYYGDSISTNNAFTIIEGVNVYVDSLATIYGCDSIVTLTLAVQPTYLIKEKIAICNGESYLWHGNALTQTGIYYDSLQTTIMGCDSIHQLTLTVNPTYFTDEDSITLCSNEIYRWHQKEITTPGIHYDTLQTVAGCDSVFKIHVRHLPSYRFETDMAVCGAKSIKWLGKSYTESGVYYDSLQTKIGCDSLFVLNLTLGKEYEITVDTTILDNTLPFVWNDSLFMHSDSKSTLLVSKEGCDSLVIMNVTVQGTDLQTPYTEVVVMYPNPIRKGGTLLIDYKVQDALHSKVEVINTMGQVVQIIKPNTSPIPVQGIYQSGLYLVKITDGKNILYGRFIVN